MDETPRSRTARGALLLAALASLSASGVPAGASDPLIQAAVHPLDPLTASELGIAVNVLRKNGYWDEDTRFPMMTLQEPDKAGVLGWKVGDPVSRRAFAIVMKGRKVFETVVDVTNRRVEAWTEVEGVEPGILLTDEWNTAQKIVRRHPAWRKAVRKRGIDNYDAVVLVPMTAGYFGAPEETEHRLVKVVSYDSRGVENYWGRPIEGLIAVVGLDEGKVLELIDRGVVPIPGDAVDMARPSFDEARTDEPIGNAPAPEPGFELEGHWISWRSWRFHWRIDPRLGFVVSLVSYEVDGKRRSILYQGSLSEMFVPYTDPNESWYFRAFMDVGEYGIGRLSSRLEAGLDCPADAQFFNAIFVDDWGNPYFRNRVGCLFERPTGDLLWRHHEGVSARTHGRTLTELVLRQITTVGNYDYVLDWIFRPDGAIRIAVGATGVPAVKAVPSPRSRLGDHTAARDEAYGRRVARHTVAINHDHFFSYRLDLDVDGRANSFLLDRLRGVDLGDDGPRPSTWVVTSETAATEHQARLKIDLEKPALWRVANPEALGPQGYPVSYQLRPESNAISLFDPGDILQKRAGFTDFHLWITPYSESERYAAGTYPNQSRGGDGLPAWTSRNRPIENTDIVLWYTLGMHHIVRAEDWPVMPTSKFAFELRPFDFFERNPAIEGPKPP